MPNAVYEPDACIRASLEAARRVEFLAPAHHVRVHRAGAVPRHRARETHRRRLPATRLPDRARRFRRGFAGLSLLANFRPDLIKIDMDLLRGIDADAGRAGDRVGRRRHRPGAGGHGPRRRGRDRGGTRRLARPRHHAVPGLPLRQAAIRGAPGRGRLRTDRASHAARPEAGRSRVAVAPAHVSAPERVPAAGAAPASVPGLRCVVARRGHRQHVEELRHRTLRDAVTEEADRRSWSGT